MAIFANGFDLVCGDALLAKEGRLSVGSRRCGLPKTYRVPLILSTFSWVISKLMYARVKPANTPESNTRTGIRDANTIKLVL